jgi:hypothetical protein
LVLALLKSAGKVRWNVPMDRGLFFGSVAPCCSRCRSLLSSRVCPRRARDGMQWTRCGFDNSIKPNKKQVRTRKFACRFSSAPFSLDCLTPDTNTGHSQRAAPPIISPITPHCAARGDIDWAAASHRPRHTAPRSHRLTGPSALIIPSSEPRPRPVCLLFLARPQINRTRLLRPPVGFLPD